MNQGLKKKDLFKGRPYRTYKISGLFNLPKGRSYGT